MGAAATRGLRDRPAQVIPQRIAVAYVKAHPSGTTRHTFPAFAAPVFGNLHGAGFHEAQSIGEVLAKEPPAMLIDDRYLVIAQAIEMIFLQQHLAVIDQELPHFRLPKGKHQPARASIVGNEIEAVGVVTL